MDGPEPPNPNQPPARSGSTAPLPPKSKEESPLEDLQKFIQVVSPLAQVFLTAQQKTDEKRLHEQGETERARIAAQQREMELQFQLAQDNHKTDRSTGSRRDWMVLSVAAVMLGGGLVLVSAGKMTEGYVLLTSPLTGLLGYFAGGRGGKGRGAAS